MKTDRSPQEWIDAKDNPPVEDTKALPVWATISKDGFRSVELVVYEEGIGWSITDDHRGELVRCEVVGEITHWMPQFRPLYPAHRVQRADKESLHMKMRCDDPDCEGIPDCSCISAEYWNQWKFNAIHDKRELFNLVRDLVHEIEFDFKFITSREKIHKAGAAQTRELLKRADAVLLRAYGEQAP